MTDEFQAVLMLIIGLLCIVSGLEWWVTHGATASGFTFVGFAIGYFGLACLFGGLG